MNPHTLSGLSKYISTKTGMITIRFTPLYPETVFFHPPPLFHNHMQVQHRAVAKGPKLSFPEFDGSDPDGWIRKAEKYYELVGVPNEDRVKIVVLYISGKAEYWWHGTGCNANILPWHQLCRMIGDRFNETSSYEAIGQFHNLKQTRTVSEYVDKFEEFMGLVKRNNPSLPEDYFINSFVSGLKDHIQHHLQCHKPTNLTNAYWFAKRLEQTQLVVKRFPFVNSTQKAPKPWVKDKEVKDQANPTIADLRAAGKCFKCREPWVPDHAKVCKGKQNFSVILVQDEEGQENIHLVNDQEDTESETFQDASNHQVHSLKISMHALQGTSSFATTFTLKVKLGNTFATALVDTGSDASLINAKFAIKAGCQASTAPKIKVAAANGQTLFSETVCLDCPYTIQGHQFKSNLRLLDIQGYDIIFGADWIYAHSPVGLNLKTREFSITKNSEIVVTFVDETLPAKHHTISAKQLCKMLKKGAVGAVMVLRNDNGDAKQQSVPIPHELHRLLLEYDDIFQEPKELPPQRQIDHTIPLIDPAKQVNQRAYRMPHHQ